MDEEGPLGELVRRILRFRDERNWRQFHTSKDLAISVSIEAAELLEIFQWQNGSDLNTSSVKKAESEVADVFIYLLLFCDSLGIDIVGAAAKKISENEKRFPIKESYGIAKQ